MCLSYYNSYMQGKHGSFITDLIILIKAPTNHVVEGKLNWVHSELRCMGASNQFGLNQSLEDVHHLIVPCLLPCKMLSLWDTQNLKVWGLMRSLDIALALGHALLSGIFCGRAGSSSHTGILYTLQLIILADKAVFHFFLAWPLLGGSPCGLDLYSTPPFYWYYTPLSLYHTLSNSSLAVFFSAPGMSSSRVALWLSSLYSHHIVTMEVQEYKLKPLSAWTLWFSAPYECLDTLLSGSSEISPNQKTSTFYFFFAS